MIMVIDIIKTIPFNQQTIYYTRKISLTFNLKHFVYRLDLPKGPFSREFVGRERVSRAQLQLDRSQ